MLEWIVILVLLIFVVAMIIFYFKDRKTFRQRFERIEDYVVEMSNNSRRLYFNGMCRSLRREDGSLSEEDTILAKGFIVLNSQYFMLRYIDKNDKIVTHVAMKTWRSYEENQKNLDEKWRDTVDWYYYWKESGSTIRVEYFHGRENDSCRIWDMEDDIVLRLELHLEEISHDGKKNDPYVTQ